MSSHFQTQQAEERTDWRRVLRRDYQPKTAAEQRFFRHAKARAVLFMGYIVVFLWFNPEYSYTMTYINNWIQERRELKINEDRLRITESDGRNRSPGDGTA